MIAQIVDASFRPHTPRDISILRNLKVAALGDYCMLFGPRVNSSHAFFSTVL
jgi:hypothetical protein